MKIYYKILINKGKLKGKEVEFTVDFLEIEYDGLIKYLIDYDYIDNFYNSTEPPFRITERKAIKDETN